VETHDQIHDSWPVYPYYPSSAYKSLLQRLITEFGQHIRSYPKEKQERIAFIQVKTGCTGDECAYKGNVNEPKYDLPMKSSAWREFRLWEFDLFVRTFQGGSDQPRIALMFNNVTADNDEGEGGDSSQEWQWVLANAHGGVGIKLAGSARGHHLSGERTKIESWQPRLIATQGTPLFARSEMDQTWQRAMFAVNLPLNFYWGALTGLQNGQSIWDISKGAIEACARNRASITPFTFSTSMRGRLIRKPPRMPSAPCTRDWMLPIPRPIRRRSMGMLPIGTSSGWIKSSPPTPSMVRPWTTSMVCRWVRSGNATRQTGLNDVGWDIWPDNYGRFLYQIDAEATSIPLWRVGGPITKTTPIYSRFARGFEHASGKDAMYFKLHEGFAQGDEPKTMTVAVVWYDGTDGSSWKLDYDAGQAAMKTALTVTGKGDEQWHHEVVTLNDAVFRHGGTKGSDLALVNTDAKDDIFSLMEVHRGKLEAPVLQPPTDFKVSDKAPMPPKADKAGKPGKEEKGKKKSGEPAFQE
jgi:hypothetical protein